MAKDPFTEQTSSVVVIFDGDCPACQFAAKSWNKSDDNKQLSFESCRTADGRQILGGESLDQIYVIDQDTVYSGVAALKEIYRRLPRRRYMLGILRLAATLRLADPLYVWFAKHRMGLGRWMRPEESLANRRIRED